MKFFLKLLVFIATSLFIVATVIKFTQKVTYKEAVGIMEELCKEMKAKCPCCKKEEEPAEACPSPEA
jgi:hypothetical protein